MNQKSQKHHYVPQFYLKGFYDHDHKLHAYDRKEKRFKVYSSSKSIAFEFGYYNTVSEDGSENDQLEKALSIFESKARPVLLKICKGIPIERDERIAFAAFTAIQSQRVPNNIKRISESLDKTATALAKELALRNAHRSPSETEIQSNGLAPADFKRFADKIDSGEIKRRADKNTVIQMMIDMAGDLEVGYYNNDWIVLHTASGSSFITSDNPVNNIGKGLLNDNNIRIFPLNKNTALVIGHTGRPTLSHQSCTKKEVRLINETIARRSDRYLISHSNRLLKRIIEITGVDKYMTESRAKVEVFRTPSGSILHLSTEGPDQEG